MGRSGKLMLELLKSYDTQDDESRSPITFAPETSKSSWWPELSVSVLADRCQIPVSIF